MHTINDLVTRLRNPSVTAEELQYYIDRFVEELPLVNRKDVGESMQLISELFETTSFTNSIKAVMLCGYLVESGYNAHYFIHELERIFDNYLNTALPFMQAMEQAIESMDNDDSYDVEDKVRAEIQNTNPVQVVAFDWIENAYPCLVACYCSDHSLLQKGMRLLNEKIKLFPERSTACYWLNKLFITLFNEPVMVVEMEQQKAFSGSISGIVDNFQLQLLLMSVPGFGEPISREFVAVVNGTGSQSAEISLPGRWDMCNWQILNVKSDSDHWIWSEGCPADISVLGGRRVIVLNKASYHRGLPVQRSFKLLEASVVVDKWLTKDELQAWLQNIVDIS